jgi:hypothetical protein
MRDQRAPWMVTQVQAQLDAMAAACNELHGAGRQIMFIVPITYAGGDQYERPTSHIAIFTLPQATVERAVTEQRISPEAESMFPSNGMGAST